jgi:AcrR family transcriptional regulator
MLDTRKTARYTVTLYRPTVGLLRETHMARIVKEHTERRSEILDVAQRLMYTRGYEQMTIQDILDDLQISKGAFYHYFDSKQTLLEAVVDRMIEQAEQICLPIVEDPDLPTLEKFARFYEVIARWKTDRKDFLLALLRVWYIDDNALLRQKVMAAGTSIYTLYFTTIIQQGIAEGVLSTPFAQEAGEIAFSLLIALGERITRVILSDEPRPEALQRTQAILAAYTDAFERVVGAPPNSIHIMDAETLREWFVPTPESVSAPAPQ